MLKFGEFTLKSGRVSPYFFNAGLLNDGEALSLLAEGYADKLVQCDNVGVIFGPAYKGIPFVAATAVALSQVHGKSVPWVLVALDRQERGQGELSAIQEVQKELEIPVHALITMKDLMDYLDAKGEKDALANMQAYREKYGI